MKNDRDYLFSPDSIPKYIRDLVKDLLGPEARVYPPRERGSYKGKFIYVDTAYLVQAIGKRRRSAIAHPCKNLKLKGRLAKQCALPDKDAIISESIRTGSPVTVYNPNAIELACKPEVAVFGLKDPRGKELMEAAFDAVDPERRESLVSEFIALAEAKAKLQVH